ncbi:DNA-binding response regulator [Sphingomonas deserti]|uniref:DNA-binding response regulator n=2 Tax=Allosphingosinicella deserti TaxID=2116704 RepID=A0A2P7QSR8_9SPHN|nr:DNA-binding response regulator [Sphingomonas deserti]
MAPVPPAPLGRLLVIDDDPCARAQILDPLAEQRCATVATTARDAPRHLQSDQFSLVILDARHVAAGGFDILRQVRARSNVPVILITQTARDEIDRVLAFELGADDLLPEPFSPRELLARIRAILRRQEFGRRLTGPSPRGGYRFQGWELRHTLRTLTDPSGAEVVLTKKEYALLTAFLDAPGRALSRLHLMRATRTHEDIFDRSIDVQVLRLRRKLSAHPAGGALIKTERGYGYRFDTIVESLF